MLIELSGTPTSGKSSIINYLCNSKDFTQVKIVKADPIVTVFDFNLHNVELRNLWRVFDTYSKVTAIVNQKNTLNLDLIVFDRGLFDRIVWTRFLSLQNKKYATIAKDLETHLKNPNLLKEIDIIFLILTSYEKVKHRRLQLGLDVNRTIVNPKTIKVLNKIYLELFSELKSKFPLVKIDDLHKDLSLEQKINIVETHL